MTKQTEALKLALEALEECRCDPRLKYEHPYYDKAITAIREALAEQPAKQLEEYDAGLLNDFGGGNVEWWQDYIRAELGRAYEHYQSQIAAQPDHIVDANKMDKQPQEPKKFDPNESFAREEAAQARVREFMRNH